MRISIDQAKKYIQDVLLSYGYTEFEAEKIEDVIFYGALRGSSQGFPKLFGWHIKKDKKATDPIFTKTSTCIGRYDSNRNNAMYVCNLASAELIKMAKKEGIASIGVYNNNNSSGAIGYYTKKIAMNGLVGIMFSSADPVGGIAPPNSKKGVFGSNPIAISIPYKSAEITLDMSTAKYTWSDLVNMAASNCKLQKGFAYDDKGNLTTDPNKAMKGMVAAFDGSYKGLGLAFMIQILAGGLIGSVYQQSDEACDYGSLMIAINPKKLAGQNFLNDQIEQLIKVYKREGGEGLLIPGERGDILTLQNIKKVSVEISEEILGKINKVLKKKI